ncbi:MAG TPA: heme-binding protein [Novosphingobium sp.]|nr:heme-binding protein [Novosphingobium sp.]
MTAPDTHQPLHAMTLALANSIIAATLEAAAAAGSKPLTVAVLDAGGVPAALARQDGCGNARPRLSIAKAEACLALHMPTRTLAAFNAAQPAAHALLREIIDNSLVPLAGGVLIRDGQGRVIGAAGVSGGDLAQEEDMLIAAIAGCGCAPDPATLNAQAQP